MLVIAKDLKRPGRERKIILNEVTGKEITQPRGVCVWGGGGGEALPLIIPYRERPRLIKGVPFSDVIKRK